MKISKVHCFFEQSGTFKNEFIKLGIPAEDYDIQDNFGETDHKMDLFHEIEEGYNGRPSVFDTIRGGQEGDLVMAFFPCIYFCQNSMMLFSLSNFNYRKLDDRQKIAAILERSENRQFFYSLLIKMYGICLIKGIRLIIENPWSQPQYLYSNFPSSPSLIDKDRSMRGDYYKNPTAYWFVNCEPVMGIETEQRDKEIKSVYSAKSAPHAGLCSEERSMISPDYARNFICDFLLGKPQQFTQCSLF